MSCQGYVLVLMLLVTTAIATTDQKTENHLLVNDSRAQKGLQATCSLDQCTTIMEGIADLQNKIKDLVTLKDIQLIIANLGINGSWSEWTRTACSVSCGGGKRTKSRSCNNPVPVGIGLECLTSHGTRVKYENATEVCNNQPCPVDGKWGEWTSWATCSTTCGGGSQTRSRKCDHPLPVGEGEKCVSSLGTRVIYENSTQVCSNQTCPEVDNLAIGKAAEQSSTWSSNYAKHAVDGDLHTESGTTTHKAWWRVDLGKSAMIYSVRLYSYWSYFVMVENTSVTIGKTQHLKDMTSCGLLTIAGRQQLRGGWYAYDVTCGKGLEGRYVQVNKNSDNRYRLIIREFEAYGRYVNVTVID